MRIEQIKICQFDELDERAKEKAREWYRSCGDCYGWAEDNLESLKAFCVHFHLKLVNWSLGGSDNYNQRVEFRTQLDDEIQQIRSVRLWKWLNNQFPLPALDGSCPFTGYAFDETLLDRIREFMKRPWDISYPELMEQCMEEFCTAYANDVDYSYSNEAVDENIRANEYEFTESGDRWE